MNKRYGFSNIIPDKLPDDFPIEELKRRIDGDRALKVIEAEFSKVRAAYEEKYENYRSRLNLRKREIHLKLYREQVFASWKTLKRNKKSKTPSPPNETDQGSSNGHLENSNLDGARPENHVNEVQQP